MAISRDGYLATKVLPDGRVLDAVPLTFGRARLLVSDSVDDFEVRDGW